ncbi:MAG: cytochrome c oxidase subunit 4 [Candidatus Eremiobacteraeota bacterium]|nr:cytochrome c oxidase subunit 4 [Candidatus Eremiobacteraeota bacterium]
MKTGIRMFLSSATFGAVVAVIYWFWSHETVGTMLLALLGGSLLFVALYSLMTVRGKAVAAADRDDAKPGDARGERIGPLPMQSVWPMVLALGVVLSLDGLVYAAWLAALGFALAAFAGLQLFWESR